jgi:cytochrome c553
MRSHFKEAAVVRLALIRSSLSDAVAPAEALSKMEGFGNVLPSWQTPIDALKAASLRISQSPDIPGAAAAMADIGVACGTCHRAAGGPKAEQGTPPAVGTSIASRMQRHVWATERLWEGLFVPTDASWKTGADALVRDPFPKELLDKGGVHAKSAAARFKSLVATAGAQKKLEDRAKLYSTLLETCSACHVAVRGKKTSSQ